MGLLEVKGKMFFLKIFFIVFFDLFGFGVIGVVEVVFILVRGGVRIRKEFFLCLF